MKLEELQRENDMLRGIIAESDLPCLYCKLAKKDILKCASGFPGCGRADDLLIYHLFKEEQKHDP